MFLKELEFYSKHAFNFMDYNPVGWFEIPVADIERATKFYEHLLGVTLRRQDMMGYEMVWFPADDKVKGITGALMKGEGYVPGCGGTVVYFTCPDIDAGIERAVSMGSKLLLPKKAIGEWGFIAWVTDSEGNNIALHTRK